MHSFSKALLAAGVAVYIIYALACVYYGSVLPEDGSYLYECYLTYHGKIPFFEFQSNPSILWPYIYGLPQFIFGLNLYVGKFTSLFFALLNLWLVYKIASAISGKAAGTIAVLLTSVNFYSLALLMHINTYALAVFFSLASFWLLWQEKYLWALIILLMGFLVRLSLAPLLIVFLVYSLWINRKSKKALLIGSFALAGVILLFSYALTLIDRSLLKILLLAPFGAGITPLQLYAEDWGKSAWQFSLNKLQVIYTSLFYYFWPFSPLWLLAAMRRKRLHLSEKEKTYIFLSGGVLAVFLLHLIPTPAAGEYNCILIPFFGILTGAGVSQIYAQQPGRFRKILLSCLLTGIVFLTFFLQIAELGPGYDNPIRQIYQMAAYLDRSVPADEKILSFYMPVAVAARREVLPNTTRGYHSYAPLITRAEAEKTFSVNTGRLRDLVLAQTAAAIFLTDGTFYNRLERAPRERDIIKQAIEDKYYLAKQVDQFAGQGTGYLYLRKEQNKK